MTTKAKYVVGLMLLCLTALTAQTGWRYDFSPAGNFPNANYSVPIGLSLTHIVGYYSVAGANNAYIQTGASFVDAAPPGSVTSYLSAINREGVAVGGFCSSRGGCNPEAGAQGYRYDSRTGKITAVVFPQTGAATTAYGINDSGTVVGGYCPNAVVCPQGLFNPASDGFILQKGVYSTLNFPGAQATSAFAVNNADTIVGYYLINNTGPHAFLYQSGTFTTIDFPGSGYTLATSINNFGVVAGLFSSSTGVHGFIYSNGTFTQVDKPGAISTSISGINDRNQAVGLWYPTVGFDNFKAVPITGSAHPSVAP